MDFDLGVSKLFPLTFPTRISIWWSLIYAHAERDSSKETLISSSSSTQMGKGEINYISRPPWQICIFPLLLHPFRFLAYRNLKKVGYPVLSNSRPINSRLQDHGIYYTVSTAFYRRTLSHFRAYRETDVLFRKYRQKADLCNANYVKKLYVSSATHSAGHQSQFPWNKILMICSSKGLASLSIRKLGYPFSANNKSSYSLLQGSHANSTAGLPFSCRVFLQHRAFRDVTALSTSYKAKVSLCNRLNHVKRFSVSSVKGPMSIQSSLVWKRLSEMCLHRRFTSLSVNKITCAMSLAFNRSHLVSSLLAFIGGELACTQMALADGEYFPITNNLYMRAQDGHIYLTSFIFSICECLMLFIRAIYLAFLFSPAIAMAPFADTFGPSYRKTWLHIVHRTLEISGPAFIKWGQWAATRPDLFPSDLCTELSKLHTNAPAHSFSYTKRTIEKAFGRKLFDIFEDFEEEPVASGSIAQVHRASLRFRHPGRQAKRVDVAVKVRHPGVGESIRRDFAIINTVAKISNFIPTLKWLRLDESVQQFAVFMMSQVDLAREAAHLSRFIYNFRRWKDVSFPKPLYPLVHPAVLVETYEQGESVSHYVDELEGNDHLKSVLAHIGTHALLKMLLVDNFVHADMHPGNILVRVSKSKRPNKGLFKSRPHVVFLDVGMTAELSSSDRVNLLEFFKAVAVRDGRSAAKCTLRLSKQQNCPNPNAFIEELEKAFSYWGTPEGDIVHPAECMHQVLEQVRRHRVNIDGNVCTVMVTTLVLEGWQRKLDPDYNVMQTLQTLLFKSDWAESLLYTIEGLMAA